MLTPDIGAIDEQEFDFDVPIDEEGARVLGWRLVQLVHAGYDEDDAAALACRFDVDLHVAAALVARGCPPATAASILL
jgi:hypothetical protein